MNLRPTLLAMALLTAPVFAESVPDVQQAAKSVYRVWLGIPLPTGFVKQTDGSHIQALQTRQFAEQVPLKGMSLLQKKSGKLKPLSGEGILFQHAGNYYLLVASGSAYAVSDKGHLVTNAKLADNTGSTEAVFVDESGLRDMGANGGQAQAFVLTQKTNSTALDLQPVKQIVRDVDSDLAVVQADNLPTKGLKLADAQFAKPAERVFALGAEGEFDQLSGKQGAIDRVDYAVAIASEGKLDKRVKQNNVNLWLHNAPISGSQTGGALVNQCGQVLGTNQLGEVAGDSQAIDAGLLLPMLRKHSIPFQQYQGRCGGVVAKAENIADGAERVVQAAQHNPRGWLTVLGLGVLTLMACGIAWRLLMGILRKRSSGQRRVSALAQQVNQTPVSPPPQPNYPNQAAVSPPAQTSYPHAAPQSPRTVLDTGAMTLTAVSGSLNAFSLPHNRPIIIGRNPQCDVVLSHPKMSGQHAKLWLEHGVVWVQDLNSTNGTFINDVRIQTPSRLNAGDVLQFTGDNSVASFRLPDSPRTELHQNTQLHINTPRLAAILQPLDANLPHVEIPVSGSVNLGRAPDNDVVIAVPQVSGKHCRVSADAKGILTIQDLNSTNGTFVNQLNQRVSQATLQTGDMIYLADQNTAYRVQAA